MSILISENIKNKLSVTELHMFTISLYFFFSTCVGVFANYLICNMFISLWHGFLSFVYEKLSSH